MDVQVDKAIDVDANVYVPAERAAAQVTDWNIDHEEDIANYNAPSIIYFLGLKGPGVSYNAALVSRLRCV